MILVFSRTALHMKDNLPGQRPSILQVEHLVRVEQLTEGVDKFQALTAARLYVYKHQQGFDPRWYHRWLNAG